ncbi:MAG: hypothetical protein KZQ66_03205 [Candidatus Thiodiazotropha sp. (ex Lucinoma aequizonata)]|nr:hypothetical protein [Candidatus Thiodiazotropha sp. (ex Lucinoma aequizonata)]MCU7896791.1 hypothetical protein [Candidatus Thiodiazotropha sp. (ex Lucinoma aequizonata)]MCU7898392.1 hypothetical protein [Candidatus Thiodiazotropha sp. (ex Lucinoma aequizonata)]MCU7901130.1 hypothetical protein [Candidatus Thiodiazotropha sp. (ex Lucinoma aequizonata)]MCU7907229.1 hypothetical protein [Candidatus Thiodiazotropha sp. (ex Lucinoma aequizonata)]
MLNSHLIGFLALAKERVRLLPFGWHPGTQLLGAHLNTYDHSFSKKQMLERCRDG